MIKQNYYTAYINDLDVDCFIEHYDIELISKEIKDEILMELYSLVGTPVEITNLNEKFKRLIPGSNGRKVHNQYKEVDGFIYKKIMDFLNNNSNK